ncbi:MAG: AAA family ATPase [Dehalococcoidia bacterium]
MHLIVVHGVPGVGKRTVCGELSRLTGFRFLNAHHLAVLLGPVFGFSTPTFNRLRDGIYDSLIGEAAAAGLPGLIVTCIFEPSVDVARFERYAGVCRERGGETVFAGLTCTPQELRSRLTSADREPLGKWTDYEDLERNMSEGYFDFPESLPGHAMVVETTGMPAHASAHHIYDRLPGVMHPVVAGAR